MNRYDEIKAMFSRFGFVACPLSDFAIRVCIGRGLSNDQIYLVGCDMFVGFGFRESVEEVEIEPIQNTSF